MNRAAPWSFAAEWGGTGHITELAGGPAHWVEFGGGPGTPIVFVHGLGGSHPAWDAVFLPDVGHTPQLETPNLVVDAVESWVARSVRV